jgi:ribose transport system ATP-binding protein
VIAGAGIGKRFGGVTALDDASFSAEAGEIHALVGENGAGKSTMIKILSGVLRPDAGTLRIDGSDVRLRSPEDALERGVATVFQELTLLPGMTVAENLLLGREPRGRLGLIRRGALNGAAAAVLKDFDVTSVDPGALVEEIPLAQRQLVEIVSAVMREPKVLFLDEPTSALSKREVEWLFALVRGLRDDGTCVIFTSHRWSEVTDLADRITIFRNGTDVGTHETISEEEAVKAMTGRDVDTAYPSPGEAGEDVLLSVRGLSAPGVEDVSFDVRRGEIVGVGGLEGQGQAELFAALFGLERPTAGEVEVDGERLRARSPRDAIRAGVAFIPQDRKADGLLLPMSVRDNLTLPVLGRMSRGGVLDFGRERGMVNRMVERLAIDDTRVSAPVGTLSGGNQQKALLGRWLLADSRVLLLYDVTRGVDVATKHDIYDLVLELAGEGRAVVLYSSDTEEIAHLCHRVLVMREGAIAETLEGPGVDAEEIIGAAFHS